MKQSETITELATALCLAQAEMGGAVKDSKNPFFKSNYADLTSVIKAIKEPFANHGLSFVQFPITSDGGKGMGVSTRIIHKSGEWLEGEYLLPMAKLDPQGAGSAVTYARRYALQAMAGIPAVDDDAEAAMIRMAQPAALPDGIPAEDPDTTSDEEYKALVKEHAASIDAICDGIADGDYSTAREAWVELGEEIQTKLWKAPKKGGCFTTQERNIMKTPEFRQAY